MKILSLIFITLSFVYINSVPLDEIALLDDSEDLMYVNPNNIEGDMLFKEEEMNDIEARNANIRARKWANGVIVFQIDPLSNFGSIGTNIILTAMKTIEEKTNGCLRFKPRTTESSYVKIQHTSDGCYSYIGNINQDGQILSLQKPGCVSTRIVIHELLHAAGFEHEQNRPGRNAYVNINFANIQNGAQSQFQERSSAMVSTLNQPYDINSIMHYR
jgi:hypothetical protein